MEQEIYQKIKDDFDKIKKENQRLKIEISKAKEEKIRLNEIITDLIKQIDIEKIDILEIKKKIFKEFFSKDKITSLIIQIEKINSFFLEKKEKELILSIQKKISKTTDNFQKIKVFKEFLILIENENFSCKSEFKFIENADLDLLSKEIDFLIEKLNHLKILKKEIL